MTEPVWWQYGAPDNPQGDRIDISDRVAARHVPGRCDRWCLDTPAGPCADQCVEDWIKETTAKEPTDAA